VAIRALAVFIGEIRDCSAKMPCGLGGGSAIVFIPRAESRLRKQSGSLLNTMDLQWLENFACKHNDVRRERARITMNINA
jgi:hypothetical protein